jgi:hypothetical protein
MATPPELVQAISEATGVALATVVDMDRRLVKAKLRTKGGRGLNAARMTALDAARLLTAVLASPQSNAAAEAVLRYEHTRPDKDRSNSGLFGNIGLDDLAELGPGHGFVEGLAALITSAAGGSLAGLMTGTKGVKAPHLEVFAFTRETHGRIRISGLRNGVTANVEYVPAAQKGKAGKPRNAKGENSGDLEQSRRITEQTVRTIARLLAGETP